MTNTKISWTKHTWNPVHGCYKISEECRHCYAATLSLKRGWTTKPWTFPNRGANIREKPHKLSEPEKIRDPARIFVNSMSDLGLAEISESYLHQIFDVMEHRAPHHTYQVLTKRPESFLDWDRWPSNVWLGVSIGIRKSLSRLDILRQLGAKVKFISFEPLLEDLGDEYDLEGIDWAIVGGESGAGYRPMDHAWARSIRDKARAAGTAYFFKQSAAYMTERGTELIEEDGTKTQYQEFPDERVRGSDAKQDLENRGRRDRGTSGKPAQLAFPS